MQFGHLDEDVAGRRPVWVNFAMLERRVDPIGHPVDVDELAGDRVPLSQPDHKELGRIRAPADHGRLGLAERDVDVGGVGGPVEPAPELERALAVDRVGRVDAAEVVL